LGQKGFEETLGLKEKKKKNLLATTTAEVWVTGHGKRGTNPRRGKKKKGFAVGKVSETTMTIDPKISNERKKKKKKTCITHRTETVRLQQKIKCKKRGKQGKENTTVFSGNGLGTNIFLLQREKKKKTEMSDNGVYSSESEKGGSGGGKIFLWRKH